MSQAYTKVGVGLFQWVPYQTLSPIGRAAWLPLYASAEVKRIMVGLFSGGLSALAEASYLSAGDASEALDELISKRMVEMDAAHRIIRLTQLPDRMERPDNGNTLIRWWKAFESLPACPTRDRHVGLIKWLSEPVDKLLTSARSVAWTTTFGLVESVSPATVSEGYAVCTSSKSVDNSKGTPYPSAYPSPYPSAKGTNQQDLFTNSGPSEGLPEGFPEPFAEPYGIRIYGSSSLEGGLGETKLAEGSAVGPPPTPPPKASGEAMLRAIAETSGGRLNPLVDSRLQRKLDQVASQAFTNGLTFDDFRLAGEFLRAGGLAYRNDLGASWATKPGTVLDLVANARSWRKGDVKLPPTGDPEAGVTGGREPFPAARFGNGIREL